jgi:hypothetical protein
MPGRKLIKKTVKSGWKAHRRTQFGARNAPSTSGVGGTRMRKRLERIGAIRSWKQENAYRKAQCVILFGTKHAPKGGLEKNRKNAEKVGKK